MVFYQLVLLDYVKQGGIFINQYNIIWNFKVDMEDIVFYYLKISWDWVIVEEVEVCMFVFDYLVFNWLNKIMIFDFEGWVQERGFYFFNEWGDEFMVVLFSNDFGEDLKNGGLLVVFYGEGYYIYFGYSWFCELLVGVFGVYCLFVNLILIGKEN